MKRSLARVVSVLAASLLPAAGEEPKVKAFIGVQQDSRFWQLRNRPLPSFDVRRIQLQIASPLEAFRASRPRTPGATVVVWGEASQARQEEMQQFARAYAPLFRTAFDVGLASSVGGQFLSQLVEISYNPNQNPAPAAAPSVWYNAQDPWARDPKSWK
jgi:hypothetical protein